MDQATRNQLRNAVTGCRRVLEQDILDQMEGDFGIHHDGRVEPETAVSHLGPEALNARRRAVAVVEHLIGNETDVSTSVSEKVCFNVRATTSMSLAKGAVG